jgi:hypothetical protein
MTESPSTPSPTALPQIKLAQTNNKMESFTSLKERWIDVLRLAGHAESSVPFHAYSTSASPRRREPPERHLRFRHRPKTIRPRHQLQTHDLENLYVVDASFFPSCGAVNRLLTVVANAIRVAHLLADRLT